MEASYSDQDVVGNESQSNTIGSKLTGAMSFTPITPLGDISGNNTQLGMYETYVRKAYDPINIINDIYDKTNRQRLRANAALSWEIIDGLTFRSEYGLDKTFSTRYYYTGAVAKNTVGVEGGDASITKTYSTRYRWVNTANYAVKGLGDSHRLDILLGQEINGDERENTSINGTRYPISFNYKKTFAMMNQYGDQNEVLISNSYNEPGRMSSILQSYKLYF